MEDRETYASWVRQERDDLVRLALLVTADRAVAVRITGRVLAELGREFRAVAETGVPEVQARRRIVAQAQELAVSPAGLPADESLAPDPDLGPALTRAWRVWAEHRPGARACAALHILDGLTIRDTAATLGLTEAAVRSHVELMLIDVAGLADHRSDEGRKARAEPLLRELMAGLVGGPLPVVEVPRFSGGRQWLVLVAVAVLVALALVVALWPSPGRTPAPAPSTTTPSQPGLTRTASAGPPPPTQVAPGPATTGWRWVSTRDAAVQVPESWVGTRRADVWGWVEVSSDGRTCSTESLPVITCLALAPSTVVVLTVWDPAEPDFTVPGDRVLRRRVGAVWLLVGVPEGADRAVAERVLASAVVVGQDELGCPVRHRAAGRSIGFYRPDPSWDVTAEGPTNGVTVCRYTLDDNDGRSTLLSSARHEYVEGRLFVAAMAQAPPEGTRCQSSRSTERVLVIRVETTYGLREAYVYPNGCVDSYFDDGTRRRQITPAFCTLLGLAYGAGCGG